MYEVAALKADELRLASAELIRDLRSGRPKVDADPEIWPGRRSRLSR